MTLSGKLVAVLFIIVSFAGCKKENNSSSTSSNTDNCVTGQSLSVRGQSVNNADIIPDQYIVSYNSSSVNARGMGKEKLDKLTTDILQKHSISSKAMNQSFAGEPCSLCLVP